MITRDSIETAYCFLHQKERIYAHSTMDWQKDDIEYAISSYVDGMNRELYNIIAQGHKDFLVDHNRFHDDIISAVEKMEIMLE
jgi:hypothetical protein